MANSLVVLLSCFFSVVAVPTFAAPGLKQQTPRIEVVYDASKDKTTVRLAPMLISGVKGKYHSLHMSPAFSYPGREPRVPEIVDFELRTVVKGKLKIDLYVLFVVNGEKVFLSSNRWGVKKGNLGRGWMGEHLVFRMPYETFLKITRASSFDIKLDGIGFPVGEEQLQALRELANQVDPSYLRILSLPRRPLSSPNVFITSTNVSTSLRVPSIRRRLSR